MVRSKEVPKKPKDSLLTPPSKPRRFSSRDDDGGFGGSLPRNRGGAAMSSPAPASVPSYMRSTSSSGAKAGQRQRAGVAPSSASASTPTRQRGPVRVVPRGKVLFPAPAAAAAAAAPGMVRPTCSSTLKDAKFPGALDLAPGSTDAEGPAAMRICPYTYCSLNGHAHSPAVPLRSFLATQRRLIKTQQSMKHKGVSAFRRSNTGHQRPEDTNRGPGVCVPVAKVDEEALGDFFVEMYTGPRVSSGTSCSDMSLDEMDATVRRMEFVVFDRCGEDGDNEKGTNDLGLHGNGDGEGTPEERLGVCRDSSSECSVADTSGNLVEELPWMRYECDSLDDDVSEEQGVIHEEIGETEILAKGQEGKDEEGTSGGSADESEEEADEEQKPQGEEIISDSPREMGIVAEEDGVDCRVDSVYQQEASTGVTQHPGDDEEFVSDVSHKMEIAAEQVCVVCPVEVCKKSEEKEEDRSEEKPSGGVCEPEISEAKVAERVENVLEDGCKEENSVGQEAKDEDKSEEQLSSGVCEPEISESEGTERVEIVLEDSCKEVNSADQEATDDETNLDFAGQLEIAEKQEGGDSEMEISETCKENFCEQETTSEAVSEGEVSDSGAVGSPDVIQPTNCGFEQDVSTVKDAFEKYGGAMNNSFEQLDTTAEYNANGTEDNQKGLEITTCKSKDASEEPGITQESSQEFSSVRVDAPVKMEPEITECEPEDSSEESSIPQESSQSDTSAQVEVCVDAPAEMEQDITEFKLDESSEESGIPQGSSQSDKSADVDNGAEIEPEFTACKSKDPSEECGIAQEIVHDVNAAYLGEGAQVQFENVISELEDTSEESGIAQEIGEDDSSAYVSDDTQNCSEITTCELADTSVTVQEADQDHSCADVSGGAQTEPELITPSELPSASEGSDVTQEAVRDDNTADGIDGPEKELETMTCEPEHAHGELDITQEGGEDDYAAGTCAGALKETQITTYETKDACEEVCNTEEANLSPVVQIPGQNYDHSTTAGNGGPQSLPVEDTDSKEFSVDDMCSIFSGMNLKGDVYVDPTESEISPRKRLIIAGRRRTPEEEEHMRGFNPRGPNFLPLELDPDSEKVDLKHQTAEDRKNAEEWMIDYALRRAVNNLGGRKKKVELLVQAFETVVPHDKDEKKNITPTRAVQTCS